MVAWLAFTQQQPEMATEGLAFIQSVRSLPTTDCAFIVPLPKQADLKRSGTYAMHSFPCSTNEDAFYVTGHAERVSDASRRSALATQFVTERSRIGVAPPSSEDALFEFDIESCLLTKTTGHGDPAPDHRVWHAV